MFDVHLGGDDPEHRTMGIDRWLGSTAIGQIDASAESLPTIVPQPFHDGIKIRSPASLELGFGTSSVGNDRVDLAVALNQGDVGPCPGDSVDFGKKFAEFLFSD